MMSLLLILNTCVTVALILIILLQKTDPASGGVFGGAGGGAQTVVRNPLAKPTAYLAALFMVLTLAMAWLNKGATHQTESVMANIEANANVGAPAPAALQPAMVGPAMVDTNVSETAALIDAVSEAISATVAVSPSL